MVGSVWCPVCLSWLLHTTDFLPDVVIGFERTLYTVDENDGQVVVSVVVMEGDVTGNVLVELTTSPGSAQGRSGSSNKQLNSPTHYYLMSLHPHSSW